MARKKIDDYVAVTTPALTDTLVCTQSGITRKETLTQLRTVVSPAASTTVTGLVKFATDAITITGTETEMAVTPSNLQALRASTVVTGIVPLSTDAVAIAGTSVSVAVTPANIKSILQALAYKLVMNVAAIDMAKGANIASAASIDIGAATGNVIDITGSTMISALGTAQTGMRRTIIPTATLPFEYNATSLVIPGSSNITALANDIVELISLGGGNWRMIDLIPRARRLLSGMSVNGSFTRDTSAASGNQTISSLGFSPSYIVIIACIGGTDTVSWGIAGSGGEGCIYINGNAFASAFSTAGTVIRLVEADGTTMNTGDVTLGDDLFTITWTKTGSPGGTATMYYLAFS